MVLDVNWTTLRSIDNEEEKIKYVRGLIAQCGDHDNIFLSDVILRGGAEGVFVARELENQERTRLMSGRKPMTWKIKVLKDEWGNVPQPGDIVKKKTAKPPKKPNGKYYTSDERNMSMVAGTYEQDFFDVREYEVDEKGCIECSFTDAGYFIKMFGVHARSGRPINTRRELSTEPVKSPNGGMLHVHYWRYKEVPLEDWSKMEKIASSSGKKRGIDKGE